MKVRDLRIEVWSLVSSLAKTFDMMSPAVSDHCQRVAYLAFRIGEELGLPRRELTDLAVAGALHDIGAFSLDERLDLLAFEEENPSRHALAGFLLLSDVPLFSRPASLVKFHHLPWRHGRGAFENGRAVPRGSHILHLADRASVLINGGPAVLDRVKGVCKAVRKGKGDRFVPDHVEAMLRLAERDYVWLDIASRTTDAALREGTERREVAVDAGGLLALARLICRIIDFKSPFTATHSSGVAASGKALARLAGFSPRQQRMFEVAAYLHDLGKLAVPSEILEKPTKLSKQEWHIMRTHVYYTHRILSTIPAFREITSWGSLHQERLNGTGYPFHYRADHIPPGARIMAVADVFTAITEDRPYRNGMAKKAAVRELRGMVARGELDATLVDLLVDHFDEIDRLRAASQARAVKEYERFKAALSE